MNYLLVFNDEKYLSVMMKNIYLSHLKVTESVSSVVLRCSLILMS